MMQRFAIAWVLACTSIGTVLSASPSLSVPYSSPHTELTYHYAVQPAPGGAEVWRFVVPQKTGELALTISSDGHAFKVATEFGDGAFREELTYSAPPGSDLGELELAWPNDRAAARFTNHGDPGRVEYVAGLLPECEKLRAGELPRARFDALELVRADYFAYTDAPRHLQMLVAGLHFASFAPLVAGDCEPPQDPQDPQAGGCHASPGNFNDCLRCCESEFGVTGFLCHAATRSICGDPVCRGLGAIVCGGMARFAASYCVQHNCLGKHGNPSCSQSDPCEGTCMFFCGPGRSAGCGHCDGQGPSHKVCCE